MTIPQYGYILYMSIHMYIYIYTYIYVEGHHQECIFHMRMRPKKRALAAAPFEHKPTDSQTHSPLPNCEETNCNGKRFWEGMWLENKQGVQNPIWTNSKETTLPETIALQTRT